MRITQGTFSFLPDLSDAQIRAQVEYCLQNGWAVSVEYTDDPHPRNTFWEMWGMPMFDLKDAAGVMAEVNRLPEGASEPLYQGERVRLQSRLGMPAALVHREPAERRAGLCARAAGNARSQYSLHHALLRSAQAGRRALHVKESAAGEGAMLAPERAELDLDALYRESNVRDSLDALDRELVGLAPVKGRVREIAALLLVEKLRRSIGLQAEPPPLHMSFTGNPGTGKTTVAMRMASILHGLGYVRKGQLVAVTRDDLVGQYIGHTAPKTKEVLKRAMGGVLFIDEAYYLYRPENERDYGQEAVEILLQVMENQRDDLVVIFAGYKDRMDRFFSCNPGLASRVAHHIDFPDYSEDELFAIASLMLERMQYVLSDDAAAALREYIALRKAQPRFSNARSIRNALDRARLRQANRLFERRAERLSPQALSRIEAEDFRASRVFDTPSGVP